MAKIFTLSDVKKKTNNEGYNSRPFLTRQKSITDTNINIETVIPGNLMQEDILCLFKQHIADLTEEDIKKYSDVIEKEQICGRVLIKAFEKSNIEKIKEKFEFPLGHDLDFIDLIEKLKKRHENLQSEENSANSSFSGQLPLCENNDCTIGLSGSFSKKAKAKFGDVNVEAITDTNINIDTIIPGNLTQEDLLCLFKQHIEDLTEEDIKKYSDVIKKERIYGKVLIKAIEKKRTDKIEEKFGFPLGHEFDFNDLIEKLKQRHENLQSGENCTNSSFSNSQSKMIMKNLSENQRYSQVVLNNDSKIGVENNIHNGTPTLSFNDIHM